MDAFQDVKVSVSLTVSRSVTEDEATTEDQTHNRTATGDAAMRYNDTPTINGGYSTWASLGIVNILMNCERRSS